MNVLYTIKCLRGKTFAVFAVLHSIANLFPWIMASSISNISLQACYQESFVMNDNFSSHEWQFSTLNVKVSPSNVLLYMASRCGTVCLFYTVLFILLLEVFHLWSHGCWIVSNLCCALSVLWFAPWTIFGGSVICAGHCLCHGSPYVWIIFSKVVIYTVILPWFCWSNFNQQLFLSVYCCPWFTLRNFSLAWSLLRLTPMKEYIGIKYASMYLTGLQRLIEVNATNHKSIQCY